MIFTKQEKLQPLNYQEADNNYFELRDIVDFVLSQTNQTNTLDQDVDDILNGVSNLQNNFLKSSNNLSDLNSFTLSRNQIEVYSKLQTDTSFLDILSNLDNAQDINSVRSNLGIGTNALRDSYVVKSNNLPEATDGNNGDIWYSWGIIISGGI